jgi:hypothetical protein
MFSEASRKEAGVQFEIGSPEEDSAFQTMKLLGGADLAGISSEWQLACLRARKHQPQRAVQLIKNYVRWRREFNADHISPENSETLRSQLRSGMVILPGTRDILGRYVVHVDLSKHDPSKWRTRDTVIYIHFTLTHFLMKHPEAQSYGIVVVNNLTNVTFSNLDFEVPRALFQALNSKFPIRLGGLYMVRPPKFFRVVFPIVKAFMKKKFQDRVRVLKDPALLSQYIPKDQLLQEFGGTCRVDVDAYADQFVGTPQLMSI